MFSVKLIKPGLNMRGGINPPTGTILSKVVIAEFGLL
jgi:hypothetical protein